MRPGEKSGEITIILLIVWLVCRDVKATLKMYSAQYKIILKLNFYECCVNKTGDAFMIKC